MSTQMIPPQPSDPSPPRRTARDEVRVVSARQGVPARMREVWRYRELLWSLIRKDLKVKYKDSVLGFAWTLLNPAVKLAIYYFVFKVVVPNGIPFFAIFLLTGLLVWNFFSEALGAATGSVVGNSSIIKKVSFPREILPLASVGASVINFLLQSLVLVLALIGFGHAPDWQLLGLLIPGMLALLVLASALGIFLGAVNVKFRDAQHLLDLSLMVWFWLTPIVYPFQQVAEALDDRGLTWVYLLNPVTPVVLLFQRVIYNEVEVTNTRNGELLSVLPDASALWYAGNVCAVLAGSLVLLAGALVVFGRLEGDFAEEL